VLQFSISREAFNYYQVIERQLETKGSIFDAPPGIALNNLQNLGDKDATVYGFFEVSSFSEASIRVYGAATPYNIHGFSEWCLSRQPFPTPECRDCRLMTNATKQPPYWF